MIDFLIKSNYFFNQGGHTVRGKWGGAEKSLIDSIK